MEKNIANIQLYLQLHGSFFMRLSIIDILLQLDKDLYNLEKFHLNLKNLKNF